MKDGGEVKRLAKTGGGAVQSEQIWGHSLQANQFFTISAGGKKMGGQTSYSKERRKWDKEVLEKSFSGVYVEITSDLNQGLGFKSATTQN